MYSFVFLLISSFFHALWNSLLKRQKESRIILFQAVVFATFMAWILVALLGDFSYGDALALTILSGFIEGVYFITLTLALAQAPMAVSYSIMRSLSMLMTWLLSYIVLQETLSHLGAMGVVSILIGLTLPIIQKNTSKTPSHNVRYFWSYICALTILGYNFTYNRALQLNISPVLLFATSLLITIPILYYSLPKTDRKKVLLLTSEKTNYKTSALLGGLILFSFTSFLYGLKDSLPAAALTIRNASIPLCLNNI
jgi:multidrug transporter EmrE-like cation transporter